MVRPKSLKKGKCVDSEGVAGPRLWILSCMVDTHESRLDTWMAQACLKGATLRRSLGQLSKFGFSVRMRSKKVRTCVAALLPELMQSGTPMPR